MINNRYSANKKEESCHDVYVNGFLPWSSSHTMEIAPEKKDFVLKPLPNCHEKHQIDTDMSHEPKYNIIKSIGPVCEPKSETI